MEEIEPTLPTKPTSRWVVAATCTALLVLLMAGGGFALHDRLQASLRAEIANQTTAREKLTARLDNVQNSLDALASQPKADSSTVDAKLTELTSTLGALTTRLEALEKKAAEAPAPIAATSNAAAPSPVVATVAPTPSLVAATPPPAAIAPADEPATTNELSTLKLAVLSGKPFAGELAAWAKHHPDSAKQTFALAAIAESGLASESDLNRKLRAALDDATASKKIDDVSLAGKINTHLAGLVSIKKTGQMGVYDALRRDVLREDIATLTRNVEALDESARKPLEPWLIEARTRRDAIAALATLDAGSH